MKAKTIVISVAVSASLLAGSIYGALRLYDNKSRSPVIVAPVSVVGVDTSWMEEDNTITGTIISKNVQNVELNAEFTLSKVHVKAGDTVKKGDPLLEYDMTIEQLTREVQDIQIQKKERDLEKKQKEFEKLLQTPGAAAIYTALQSAAAEAETEIRTQAADLIEEASFGEIDAAVDAGEEELIDDNTIISEPVETDTGTGTGTEASLIDDGGNSEQTIVDDSGSGNGTAEETSDTGSDEGSDESLIVDENIQDEIGDEDLYEFETEYLDDTIEEEDDGSETIITDDDETGEITEADDLIQARILEFLMLEELIRTYQYTEYQENQDLSIFSEDDLTRALAIFQSELSETPGDEEQTISTFTDAFGDEREEKLYYLSTEVRKALKQMEKKYEGTDIPFSASDAAASLYKAYTNVAFYNLIYRNGKLEEVLAAAGTTPLTCSAETAKANREYIVAAANAYYKFSVNWNRIKQILEKKYDYTEEELEAMDEEFTEKLVPIAGQDLALGDSSDGSLSYLIGILNIQEVIQETEPETQVIEPETDDYEDYGDDYDDYDDYDDDYDFDDEEALSQEELEDAITDTWMELKEIELDIRETQSKIREEEKKLSQRVVYAEMDGVVKSAGTVKDADSVDEYFIVLTGEAGMYAKGSVSEMELGSIRIGDVITGVSSETGESFTATITEVSEYPEESGDDYYYGYDINGNNPNSSNYPFLAYIEDTSGLEEGYADLSLSSEEKGSSGLYLEQFLIREDDAGKDYVMIRGEDGLLKKQIVKTGKVLWGAYVQIKSGLSQSDMIAFPYGKNVVEGAKTQEQDNLDYLYTGMG